MLTRNCAVEKLLIPGDFNVRVTVFNKDPKYYVPTAYKRAWIETIRDSLGGDIIHSNVLHHYCITQYVDKIPYCKDFRNLPGCELTKNINSLIYRPTNIRIDLISGYNTRSWIILV